MRKTILLIFCTMLALAAYGTEKFVSFERHSGSFQIIRNGTPLDIYISNDDHEGVRMAGESLSNDILAVCGAKPSLIASPQKECIIAGSLQSAVIRQLAADKKIDIAELEGTKETECTALSCNRSKQAFDLYHDFLLLFRQTGFVQHLSQFVTGKNIPLQIISGGCVVMVDVGQT